MSRFQFSVENPYTVSIGMPQSLAARVTSRSATMPRRWPSIAGNRRERAQRRLPSMMIATCLGSRLASSVTPRGGLSSVAMLEPFVPVVPGNELPRPVVLAPERPHAKRPQYPNPNRSIRRRQHAKPQSPVTKHLNGFAPRQHRDIFKIQHEISICRAERRRRSRVLELSFFGPRRRRGRFERSC